MFAFMCVLLIICWGNRIGRKVGFILAYAGIVMAFSWAPFMLGIVGTTNLWLVMMGSLFFLVGGGVPVAINCLYAMAGDVAGDEAATGGR